MSLPVIEPKALRSEYATAQDAIDGLIDSSLHGDVVVQDVSIIENTTGHDKVHVMVVVEVLGVRYLIRMWGKHDSKLVTKVEMINGNEMDAILVKKLDKGYEPVDLSSKEKIGRYHDYMRQVDTFISGYGKFVCRT